MGAGATTKPCGCREEERKRGDRTIVLRDPCPIHRAQSEWGMLHWEGHEECCDVPQMLRCIEANGVEVVRQAVEDYESTDRFGDAAYIRRVFELASRPKGVPPKAAS